MGGKLKSIILYGSASSGEYIKGQSDINLLLVCDNVDLGLLKTIEKTVRNGIRRRISAPLLFTPEHIERAKDVFPIEFLDMRDNHLVLYGEDIFLNLKIGDEHLRLECEEQIKGKLIRTRQAWFEVSGNRKRTRALLYTSLMNIIPALRGIIRLLGEDPPVERYRIIEMADRLLDVDLAVFREIFDIKREGKSFEVNSIFQRYLDTLSSLAGYVDVMLEKRNC